MQFEPRCRRSVALVLILGLPAGIGPLAPAHAATADVPKNLFSNASFEMGRDGWHVSKARKTDIRFSVDREAAVHGRHSVLISMGTVEEWGAQFGQSFPAGAKGKTYTFAVHARSEKGPVEVDLQIERGAKPWDRAVRSPTFRLTEEWQELHVTFDVEKDFPQGWFAYISCTQPQARYRADMFRLYEGPYALYTEAVQPEAGPAMVRLFDTVTRSAEPMPSEALEKRTGWVAVPEGDIAHSPRGSIVLLNDRIAVALRPSARGAEVYSTGSGESTLRALLVPAPDTGTLGLSSCAIVENSPTSSTVDAVFGTAEGARCTLRFGLRMGQAFVQAEARDAVTGLRVEAPCRFAVLPDFFADDIVIDATELPVSQAELPSDNMLLHLLPDREAIVMTVVSAAQEDVSVCLADRGRGRMMQASELSFGKDGKIWVAVLASPGIWHVQEVSAEQAGTVVRLDWTAPFPAQWRTDWRRDDGLTDSWEMLIEKPDGSFAKHSVFGNPGNIPASRKRWTTVLGRFSYPCWIDKNGRGFLQPLKTPVLRFRGPALVYPMNRTRATGLETFTVVDIMRNTLGVGPCEYVLDVEGQRSAYKGRATCSVRDTLDPIYTKAQQKERRAEIEKVLVDLMLFIRHIRDRIEAYRTFGHEALSYLAEQKRSQPALAACMAELETLARVIDKRIAARADKITTPEQVARTVETFRQTVLDNQGDDALAKCKQFTAAWVQVGGNQDELAGECRWAVKVLRQKAGLLMATDPQMAEVAKEIRQRSRTVLRNPAGHEGARH